MDNSLVIKLQDADRGDAERSPSPAKLYSPWCKKANIELKVYNHESLDQDKNKVIVDPNNSAFKPVTRPATREAEKQTEIRKSEKEILDEHLGGEDLGSGKSKNLSNISVS